MIPFNNSQILGLDLDKHIALDAGAGTGKTAVMAERYVQHLISAEQRATILLPNGPCLLYTSPSPRDVEESRMPSSA